MTLDQTASIEQQLKALAAAIVPEGFDFRINVFPRSIDDRKTAEKVQEAALCFLNVSKESLLSKSRKAETVKARKFISTLVKSFTQLPLKSIADYAGHRNQDHSAVLHSIASLKDWLDTDDNVRNQFEQLQTTISSTIQLEYV